MLSETEKNKRKASQKQWNNKKFLALILLYLGFSSSRASVLLGRFRISEFAFG
jgi:hypothetical protein